MLYPDPIISILDCRWTLIADGLLLITFPESAWNSKEVPEVRFWSINGAVVISAELRGLASISKTIKSMISSLMSDSDLPVIGITWSLVVELPKEIINGSAVLFLSRTVSVVLRRSTPFERISTSNRCSIYRLPSKLCNLSGLRRPSGKPSSFKSAPSPSN